MYAHLKKSAREVGGTRRSVARRAAEAEFDDEQAARGTPGGGSFDIRNVSILPPASSAATTAEIAAKHEDGDYAPPPEEEAPIPVNTMDPDDLAETHAETHTEASSPAQPVHSLPANLSGSMGLQAVIRPGGQPETVYGALPEESLIGKPKSGTVAAGGAPTGQGAGSNDCTPAASTLAWAVVDDGPNWRVDVTGLGLAGQVNVRPWPSAPTTMTVPNTSNPVDGGNINNTAGSANNFQAAIDDMADYHTAGGGAGPNWHSTAASSAHEWAHWNTDWIADSVNSNKGGDWSRTNRELDLLKVPKGAAADGGAPDAGAPMDAAAARNTLEPRVNARMSTFNNAAVTRWNAIPDTPGVAGSTGYIAGAVVLSGLIAGVQAYKTAKGW